MIKSRKAEMGIGTLILFIAMLLVAAVAAGILIQTNSSLQEQALTTGDQATSQISTNVRVIEISATDGSDGTVEVFNQILKLAPGSDEVKIDQLLLSFNTFNTTSTLTYCGTSCNNTQDPNSTDGVDVGYYTAANGTGIFTVEYLQRGSNPVDGNLQRGDIVRLYYESPRGVDEDEKIRVGLIPKIGTPSLTEFITPEVISQQRVYLYP